MMEDVHSLRGMSGLGMYDLFWDDCEVFVLGDIMSFTMFNYTVDLNRILNNTLWNIMHLVLHHPDRTYQIN